MQSFFDIEKARTIYQVLKALPIMGRLNFQLSLQKLSSSLAMMLESSLDFFESLKQSGLCSTEIKIQQAIDRIIPKVRSGIELELAFKDEPIFPSEFTTALSLGAQSGKIPEFLNRYSNGLKIQIDSTIKSLVKWFPIAIYWMIIIQMAFAFVGFYKSYLENLLKLAP